jgi:hypothetical protein
MSLPRADQASASLSARSASGLVESLLDGFLPVAVGLRVVFGLHDPARRTPHLAAGPTGRPAPSPHT